MVKIKTLEDVLEHKLLFEIKGWSLTQQQSNMVLYKTKLSANGALILTHCMRIDAGLNLFGYANKTLVMKMWLNDLTIVKILLCLDRLEKEEAKDQQKASSKNVQGQNSDTVGCNEGDENRKGVAKGVREKGVQVGTPDERLKCSLCNRSFKNKNGLAVHKGMVHPKYHGLSQNETVVVE